MSAVHHAQAGEMRRLTDGLPSKSAKIRTLGRAGYSRSEIANFLGIKYQFVRNVLVDAERTGGAGASAQAGAAQPTAPQPAPSPGQAVALEIGPGGEVVIPAHLLAAAGIGPGQRFLARFEDDEIKLVTPEATRRKIQTSVRKLIPEGVSLVDELLAERRREVEKEEAEAAEWGRG